MVSFDVESLFTIIPLLESIELTVDSVYFDGEPVLQVKHKDNLKDSVFLIATA